MQQQHIAIFGPTGYIGTKMIIELYNMGHKISLFSRSVRKLDYVHDECYFLKDKEPRICVVEQHLHEGEFEHITESLKGVDVVYYLVHSLYILEKENFTSQDNQLASLIAKASAKAGVKQIIYLGGLGVDKPDYPISEHLLSRQDTANYLRAEHECVTEFRAGVIIGAGSSSFEIIRSLGTKLPFIPQLYGREGICQPIFVDNVIEYLIHALLNPNYFNRIAEIGSENVLTYSKMIQIFAETILNKNLIILPMPLFNRLLTPYILSRIISRMTNMPSLLIERLLEGMHSYAVIGNYPIEKIDPNSPIKTKNFKEAIKIATKRTEKAMYQSVWSTPYELSVLNAEKKKQFLQMSSKEIEGMLFEEYSAIIEVKDIDRVFNKIKDIGGTTGYYSPKWLWQIRGFIDIILGGRGLNPNKQDATLLRVGNRIDFWVVSHYKNLPYQKSLRLKAHMITPGDAWLQFTINTSKQKDNAVFTLRAYFEPSGIGGYLYWYSLYFIHKYIFKEMVKNIIKP